MGREIRMVPPDWKHPKRNDDSGSFIPLYENDTNQFKRDHSEWVKDPEGWDFYEPLEEDYMPYWPPEERTYFMMYENTSEGTPISPAFKTPEELAKWLADNKASSMGRSTATYDQWLNMIKGTGWSLSGVICQGRFMSGVEALTECKE